MKRVISASRRTDLVAFFPEWLSSVLKEEKAFIYGPSGHTYTVDLNPEHVHSLVLWSKNFSNLIQNQSSLKHILKKYDHLYLHFTITGLGGSFIEKEVPPPAAALTQLEPLLEMAGLPQRISVRFDPVVYWREGEKIHTNLTFFEKLAPGLKKLGIEDVRLSFAQWYNKAKRRAAKYGFSYVDPSPEEKKEAACHLVQVARAWDLSLFSCSQDFLAEEPGIVPSACIDGSLLNWLHPHQEEASVKKDRTQRAQCRCTESVDIGSYTQFCPHSCLYCYANPKI
ncbi:MAG: DUF1848 family protein [Candidatus Aminicenantes bacterium]